MAPGYCLDRVLQLGQRELLRHELENNGPIFELGTQSRDGCCKDSPVVKAHRLTQGWEPGARQRHLASIAPRLYHQSRFVKELITVEDLLLVPWTAVDAETELKTFAPSDSTARLRAV